MILRGGYTNDGQVVRVGDTVRRPWRATSPATGALLEHLERVGFDGAPRFLGRDEDGRETLSFIAGEAAIEPQQPWALTDEALVSVARAAARASTTPSRPSTRRPTRGRRRSRRASATARSATTTRTSTTSSSSDGRAVALIDFDLASPGSAVWDVACAARLWAPLRDPADVPHDALARAPAAVPRCL